MSMGFTFLVSGSRASRRHLFQVLHRDRGPAPHPMSTSSSLAILAKAARSSLDSPHSVCISVKLRILPGHVPQRLDDDRLTGGALERPDQGGRYRQPVLSSPMPVVATSPRRRPSYRPKRHRSGVITVA